MSAAAGRLARRVLVVHVALGVTVTLLLAWLGPHLLLLSPDVAFATLRFSLGWALAAGLLGMALLARRLRGLRFVLRALSLRSTAVEPEDIEGLLRLPGYVALVTVSLGLFVPLLLLSPLRPTILDFNVAVSVALLIAVIVATAALPLHVALRARVSKALELVHPDTMHALVEREMGGEQLRRRVIFRLLAATVMPVGLVAVGAALIAHAHVRVFDAKSRERTAEVIAYALEPLPSVSWNAGRAEAMHRAHALGFAPKVSDEAHPFSVERDRDGRVSLTVPFDEGSATIRFAVSHVGALTQMDFAVALFAVLLASALGYAAGRSLTSDLVSATSRLSLLSTEEVLLGRARAAPPTRWRIVGNLNQAIDTLTERFRVFSEAQSQAIESRETANRARSLLFASVSHDLRNPLNAILGFTALIEETKLEPPQRESLDIIEKRGRELLVLIESILEMARVEAGQLELSPSEVSVEEVVAEAVRKGEELIAGRKVHLIVEVEPDLPKVQVDARRLSLAIAALIGNSARIGEMASRGDEEGAPVRIRATRPLPGDRIEIEVEHLEGSVPTPQIKRLLRGDPDALSQRRYSGLTLGLSLARAIVELHGETLRVSRGAAKTTKFRLGLRKLAKAEAALATAGG